MPSSIFFSLWGSPVAFATACFKLARYENLIFFICELYFSFFYLSIIFSGELRRPRQGVEERWTREKRPEWTRHKNTLCKQVWQNLRGGSNPLTAPRKGSRKRWTLERRAVIFDKGTASLLTGIVKFERWLRWGRPEWTRHKKTLCNYSLITKCLRIKPIIKDKIKKTAKVKIADWNASLKSRFPVNLCFSYSCHVITNAISAARNPNIIPMRIEITNITRQLYKSVSYLNAFLSQVK